MHLLADVVSGLDAHHGQLRVIAGPEHGTERLVVDRRLLDVPDPAGHAGTSSRLSSSPNFARRTNWPTPGDATSSPSSTSTWPRSSTTSGTPVTSVPSNRL